jgi:hypothetical protein
MLIDTRDAAGIYDISESTLAKWRLKGCGPPYIKRGRWLRYDTDKFDAWLAAHERTSTSQMPPTLKLPPVPPKRRTLAPKAPRREAKPGKAQAQNKAEAREPA